MSRPSRSVLVAVVSFVVLLTSMTAVGQSVYYQAYDRGIKAYEAGNLPLARQMFERALQLDSRQARNKNLGGTFFGAYLPDYYLGLIATREKRYDEAVAHFDRLRTLNLVGPRDKEYATLNAQRAIAEEAIKTATLARSGAPPAGPVVAPGPSTPPPELANPGPPVQSAESARQPETPADARGTPTIVARAGEPPAAPVPSLPSTRPPSSSAAADIGGLSSTISRDFDRGEFERAWEGVQRLAAMPGGAESARGFADLLRAAIATAGESHLRANDVGAADRLSSLLTRVAPTSPEARNLRQHVDGRLKDARLERDTLKRLLLGQYQQVIDLTGARIADDPASARLLFFAACSHAALSLTLPADARARPVAVARQLFGRASGMGASFSREEQYISPEILAVLKGR